MWFLISAGMATLREIRLARAVPTAAGKRSRVESWGGFRLTFGLVARCCAPVPARNLLRCVGCAGDDLLVNVDAVSDNAATANQRMATEDGNGSAPCIAKY